MRNEKLAKSNVSKKTLFLLLLISSLFVFACEDPSELYETPLPSSSDVETENGYGKISITFAEEKDESNLVPHSARTVFPLKTFDAYVYTFTKSGGTADMIQDPDSNGFFTLEVGTYTVTVQAFTGDTPVAGGESVPFTVDTGYNDPVEIRLSDIAAATEGKFMFAVTWPEGAEGEITLQRWPDMNDIDLNPVNVSEGNGKTQTLVLETDSYLLTILINKNKHYAGISEAVHIYPAVTTEYTKDFTDDNLLLTQYTVTFDPNGATAGTTPLAQTIGAGSGITLPSSGPVKPGYIFGGWNTSADGTGDHYNIGVSYIVTDNSTLYARWDRDITYTVTYSINGGLGTTPASQTVLPDGSVTLPNNSGFSRAGYTFEGWSTNSAGTGVVYNVGSSYAPTAGITFYARWYCTVTFDINGATGTAPNPQTVLAGSSITIPSGNGLSKAGYTFGGWTVNPGGSGTVYNASSSYKPAGNVTFYARWVYLVSFSLNGGTGTVPSTQASSTSVTLPSGTYFYRSGYAFIGWRDGTTGTIYNAGASYPVTGNITLSAQWGHSVTFNANNGTGTVPNPIAVAAGSGAYLPDGSGLSKNGYLFGGWNTSANGTGTNYAAGYSYTVNANVTLYARWVVGYTVTFDINSGTGTVPSVLAAPLNSTIGLPDGNGMSKSGYVFDCWNTSANGTGTDYAAGSFYTVTSNTTLYAKWVVGYRVYFSANGATSGTAPSVRVAAPGRSIVLPDTGTLWRSGYTFGGWNTNADGTGDNYFSGTPYTPSGETTLYARWNPIQVTTYTVTFDINGGTGTPPAPIPFTSGSTVALPDGTGFSRSGFVFIGWSTNAAGTGLNFDIGGSVIATGSITLYARWVVPTVTVTVTYNLNNGTGTTPVAQTGTAGSFITLPAGSGFSRSGYTFDGWDTSADGAGTAHNAGASYALTNNVTLYARWVFVVTFDSNGAAGTPPGDYRVPPNTGVPPLPGGLSRSGYIFMGWSTNADGTGTLYRVGASFTPTGNITLYARWIQMLDTLTEDDWRNGPFSSISEEHWFGFTASASTQYIHIYLVTQEYMSIQVYDANINTVGASININRYNSIRDIAYSLTAGQTYYIQTKPFPVPGNTGNYQITYNKSFMPPVTDMKSSGWTTGYVYPYNDNGEWFRFTATANPQYIHFSPGGQTSVYVQVYDSNGNKVGASTELFSALLFARLYTSQPLTVGQVYYIQAVPGHIQNLDGYGSGFRLAVNGSSTPPP